MSEEPGASPLAWRGAQLSRAINGFLERAGVAAMSFFGSAKPICGTL